MRTTMSRRGLVIGAVATTILGASGCQSAVKQAPSPGGGDTPVKGGEAVVAQNADPQLTAILAQRAGNANWVMNVYEPLLRYDDKGDPQPVLATGWKFSEDGLTVTVTLRSGVTFHSGRAFTAEDVVFSISELAKPESSSQLRFVTQNFTSVKATSPEEVTIVMKKPMRTILDLFDFMPIIDKDTWSDAQKGRSVVGTGPFMWASWNPGADLVLKRYDGHREPAMLDSITLPLIADATAQVSAIRSGRVMFSQWLTSTDAFTFKDDAKFTLVTTPGSVVPLGVDTTKAPFDKKEVRQALGFAVDRERIGNQVFAGAFRATPLYWSPREKGYDATFEKRYPYDAEKAKKLISDAGATGAAITISIPAYAAQQSTYEIVRNNLEEVGFTVSVKVLNATEYNAQLGAGDVGQSFITTHGSGFSAQVRLNSIPTLRTDRNVSHWTDPEYDRLKQQLAAAATDDETGKALSALAEYMLDEAFGLVLVDADSVAVQAARFRGVTLSATGQVLFGKAYITP